MGLEFRRVLFRSSVEENCNFLRRSNTTEVVDDNKNLLEIITYKKCEPNCNIMKILELDTKFLIAKKNSKDETNSLDEYRSQATCNLSNDNIAPAIGLTNYGVTCYVNSSFQCLLSVPEMSAYFLERSYEITSPGTNFRVCHSISELYNEVFNSKPYSWITPKALINLCISGQ